MENIDIKNISVTVNIPDVLNAISTKSFFEIDINGKFYLNTQAEVTMPIVFKSKPIENSAAIVDSAVVVKEIFKEYRPVINGAICKIKPLIAWQQVIDLNKGKMLYFDHQSDGVEIFEDKELEDMGWEATALDITYREIAEHIEKSCSGALVFYDNGTQFNGFVIAKDIEEVRQKVKSFIVARIEEKMNNDEIDRDDDDVCDALSFFGIE